MYKRNWILIKDSPQCESYIYGIQNKKQTSFNVSTTVFFKMSPVVFPVIRIFRISFINKDNGGAIQKTNVTLA